MSTPRSLADELRGRSAERLAALLQGRPDLTVPAPQDSSQLASRASTRASVLRALDGLTRLELVVLDAVVAVGARTSAAAVRAVVRAEATVVDGALARLRDLALLWGPDEDLRVVGAVAEAVGTTASGLAEPVASLLSGAGPERVATLLAAAGGRSTGDRAADVEQLAAALCDPARVAALLEDCGDEARELLDHLDRSGASGSSRSAREGVTVSSAEGPVEQLVARALLLHRDPRHLAVPREVSLALRGGRTTYDEVGAPPPLATAQRGQALVDRAAAGGAQEAVHRVEALLDHWGEAPPAALRQGGLGVRDLRAAAALVHGDSAHAALLVEVAAEAGLLALGSTPELDAAWLPTAAYDAWRDRPPAERWAALAGAWLATPRLVGLVGGRLRGGPVNALAPDLEQPWLPETRRHVLEELGAAGTGRVLRGDLEGLTSLQARVAWRRPRRPPARDGAVGWVLEEGAVLGLLALGGLAAHGRALLDDGTDAAAQALAPLLPPPVDHVLLQADLTAVAPGPLEERLARALTTVAEVESRGGATVYRFTEASVRRALDVGWSALEVHDAIATAARTEVPQPLRYLIDDVARRHGTVRVGAARAFLRADDEAALTALVHDPRAASLRLRRIAPTVVVTDVPPDVLLPRLRELGVAPVVEGPDGEVRVGARERYRTRTPRRTPGRGASVTATVAAVRAGDRVAASAGPMRAETPVSALARLREAAETGETVSIGFVDAGGSVQDRVVDPQRVDGGWLRAYDHRSREVRSYALHRIAAVRPL